jgi:hypothetical protein
VARRTAAKIIGMQGGIGGNLTGRGLDADQRAGGPRLTPADRVIRLRDGRVLQIDSPRVLTQMTALLNKGARPFDSRAWFSDVFTIRIE